MSPGSIPALSKSDKIEITQSPAVISHIFTAWFRLGVSRTVVTKATRFTAFLSHPYSEPVGDPGC